MKKFAPIFAVAFLGVMLTSCSKKYDCVCKDADGKQISSTDLSSFKSTAKTLCKTSDATYSSSVGGSCKLQ